MLDLARTWFWLVGRAGETDRDRAGVTARGGTSSPEAVSAMGVPKDARLCCIDSGAGPPSGRAWGEGVGGWSSELLKRTAPSVRLMMATVWLGSVYGLPPYATSAGATPSMLLRKATLP